jgi:hypothetical protein
MGGSRGGRQAREGADYDEKLVQLAVKGVNPPD